jgi:hypothetical protein
MAKGLADDIMNGTNAADTLNNALRLIASKLANKAIDSLIGGVFGCSTGDFNLLHLI